MCGFILSLDDPRFSVNKACELISHRGPTATKYYVDSRLKCGFNRLAIVDPNSHSDQPMIDKDGKWLIMFNGEIYNFRDLRKDLMQRYDYKFITESDTEVLLVGLGLEGRNFVKKINGIYAFVFIDLSDYSILLGRDPFGVKPLYYAQRQNSWYFCSETKPLAEAVGAELDRQSLALFLSSGSPLLGKTIYNNIKALPPNSLKAITKSSVKEYQARPIPLDEHIMDITEDEIIDRIARATTTQLPDLDYGLQFSGGVDSTFLLSLINKSANFLGTYSVNVNDPEMSEKYWQDIAISNFGSGKLRRVIDLGVEDFQPNNLRDVAAASDLPFFHPSFLGSTMMAKKASDDGLKVLISGEGADEIFLGYRWFYDNSSIPSIFEYSPLNKLCRYLGTESPDMTFLNEMDRLTFFQNWYLQRWLSRSDLTGMRHSIEVRVPFLDLDLVSFVNSINRRYKVHGGSKWILKNHLAELLSKDFVARRKRGFDFPLNAWMKDEHRNFLRDNKDLFDFSTNDIDSLCNSSDFKDKRLIFSLCSFAVWMGR